MNLGLGHLSELKAHLLNEALRSESTFDSAIAALGKGVAARFDTVCQRQLARAEDATADFPASECHFSLPRYPIEEIARVELRETLATGWIDQGAIEEVVANILNDSGIVLLHGPRGAWEQRLRFTYTGGYWYPTAPAVVVQSGSVAVASGGFAADVAFASTFEGVPSVKCSVIAPEGELILSATAYQITESGFTVRLSAATAAAGYSISWVAVYGAATTDPAIIQEATVDIASGVGQFDVVFAAPFAAAPVVVCQVVTPEGGFLVSCAPSLVTATGFRALLSWTTDAATYKLSYVAVNATAAAAATTLPTGATALPEDLKLAWLLQCEHVWKLRDKLGNSIVGGGDGGTLAGADIIPAVAGILRAHRRYALT